MEAKRDEEDDKDAAQTSPTEEHLDGSWSITPARPTRGWCLHKTDPK